MNREICFRLWDKHLKQMIFEGYHVIGEVTMFGMINQHVYENPGTAKSSLERYNDFVEMQFIGLTDKNNKNIYEGDLISDEHGRIWRIFWNQETCSFRYEMINQPKKKFDGRIGKISTGCQKYLMDMMEVIGNEFENHELIKQ